MLSTPQGSAKASRPLRPSSPLMGKNVLMCSNKVVLGPDFGWGLVTATMILVPTLLFVFVICPDFGGTLETLTTAVALTLAAVSLTSLVMTAVTEPGIIPRCEEEDQPVAPGVDPETGEPPKYCHTCNVYRPPRAKHCAKCDNCVLRFDHHCTYIGTCIGHRNYRHYLVFLITTTLLAVVAVAGISYRLAVRVFNVKPVSWSNFDEHRPVLGSKLDNALSWGLGLFAAVGLVPLLFLTVSHMYLVSTNQTTAEFVKRNRQGLVRKPNPARGIVSNCVDAWCHEVPESQLPDAVASQTLITIPPAYPSYSTQVSGNLPPPLRPLPNNKTWHLAGPCQTPPPLRRDGGSAMSGARPASTTSDASTSLTSPDGAGVALGHYSHVSEWDGDSVDSFDSDGTLEFQPPLPPPLPLAVNVNMNHVAIDVAGMRGVTPNPFPNAVAARATMASRSSSTPGIEMN